MLEANKKQNELFTTIKIKRELKQELDILRIKHGFRSMSEMIELIHEFYKINS